MLNELSRKREIILSAILHSVFFLVWLGLVIYVSLDGMDLAISHKIVNKESFLGAFFAETGQWPAYFITPFATCIFFYNVDKMTKKKGGQIALRILFGLIHFAGWFMFFGIAEKIYELPHEKLFGVFYGLIATFMCLYFARFLSRDFMSRMLKFAIFSVVVLVVSRAVVTLIKLGWSRPRYRDMIKDNAFEYFTPWYHPNGFGYEVPGHPEYKLTSFPSGHVTSAFNIFVIVVLADICPSLKKHKLLSKIVLYTISVVFSVMTMVYRVVFMAHFFSDTLWAAIISYGTFYLCKFLFFRGGKFTFESKDETSDAIVEEVEDSIDVAQ